MRSAPCCSRTWVCAWLYWEMGAPALTSIGDSTTTLTDFDLHLLHEGTHCRIYEKLGAHPANPESGPGTAFSVWAPNAKSVSVVGDFPGWRITRRGSGSATLNCCR